MTEYIVLLWLADVAKHVAVLGVACLITLFASAVTVGLMGAVAEENFFPKFRNIFAAFAAGAILAGAMPSEKTVYAAIALKAGHDIAQTELGTKAHEALNALLDRVIAEAKK